MTEKLTRDTVARLALLYERRESLQSIREMADHNFWVSVVNDTFKGTGTRSAVLNGVGGNAALIGLFTRSVDGHFNSLIFGIDSKISDLGGEP